MKPRMIRMGALWSTALLLFTCAGAAAAQGSGTRPPDPPAIKKAIKTVHTEPRPSVTTPVAPATPPGYRIGVSDLIDVHIWKEPELSRSVPVLPDGKVSLPLAGEVEAAGKTIAEMQDIVRTRLKAYLADPEVTIVVQQVNSKRYFMLGEVGHAGSFPLNVPTTVIQALAAAGGFREWAQTDNVLIIRHLENNETVRLHFNYKDWLKKGSQADGMELKDGDVVVVP
jgi:polysaccharide export outer membrane protein